MKPISILFPALVAGTSLYSLYPLFVNPSVAMMVSCTVGITGSIMFFFVKKHYRLFFQLWLLTQFVILPNVWDAAIPFEITVGLDVQLRSGLETGLKFNLIAILYWLLYRMGRVLWLIGSRVTIKDYEGMTRTLRISEVDGKISGYENFSINGTWMRVELSLPLMHHQHSFSRVSIKKGGTKTFYRRRSDQTALIRLPRTFSSDGEINDEIVDWILVDTH